MIRIATLIGIFGVGCAAQDPQQPTDAARQLGIDHYTVSYSATSMEIQGLDATDHPVAVATLKLGRFTMEDEGDVTDGRQLDINVDGKSAHHESRGFGQLNLPLNGRSAEIRTFLLDPLVAKPLLQWGVGFDARGVPVQPKLSLETPYELQCGNGWSLAVVSSDPYGAGGGCSYASNCSSLDCTEFDKGGGEYGQFVCCWSGGKATERACTSPHASSGCGTTGDLGCAPCWDMPESGCNAYDGPTHASMHFCTP